MKMKKTLMNLCNKRLYNIRMEHSVSQENGNKFRITTKDEKQEMMKLWPSIVRDLTDNHHPNTPQIKSWLTKLLQYNVPKGKMTRATDLINVYKQLASSDQLNEKNIRLARILGWCHELFEAFVIIADDIMDQSAIRRGQLCWYLHNDIGLGAVNDGILVKQLIYRLLRMHFKHESCYQDLVESFLDITYKTAIGEYLDMSLSNLGKKQDLNLFTMGQYYNMIKYKTNFCTFILPITLAKHLAGIKDNEELRQVERLLHEIGYFFQIQNDYLDCYGDPEITGKNGTDIREGKCTWLIVNALQRVTLPQRKILEECYGVNDPEKIARVKKLYNELGMETIYNDYGKENFNLSKRRIQEKSPKILKDFLFTILNREYRSLE